MHAGGRRTLSEGLASPLFAWRARTCNPSIHASMVPRCVLLLRVRDAQGKDKKLLIEWGAEFDNFDPETQVRR